MATASDDTKTKTATKKSARAAGQKTAKPTAEARTKRSQAVAAKSKAKAAKPAATDKGLADLFEHALADMYYAEKKIYKTLPKMIKAADHPDLIAALTAHREETAGQIETLEAIFELLGKRAKAVKCDAIDGILEEGESLLEDFGDSVAADAAIIARMTRCTSPPASTWLSISGVLTLIPARIAWIRALTIAPAFTFRSRIPTRSRNPTRAPLTSART